MSSSRLALPVRPTKLVEPNQPKIKELIGSTYCGPDCASVEKKYFISKYQTALWTVLDLNEVDIHNFYKSVRFYVVSDWIMETNNSQKLNRLQSITQLINMSLRTSNISMLIGYCSSKSEQDKKIRVFQEASESHSHLSRVISICVKSSHRQTLHCTICDSLFHLTVKISSTRTDVAILTTEVFFPLSIWIPPASKSGSKWLWKDVSLYFLYWCKYINPSLFSIKVVGLF